MNVLFLTLLDFDTFDERNIYSDLLREFIKNGHNVYCISPVERRNKVQTHFEENGHILKLKIGNTQKTNVIEKGFSTLMIESQFVSALKKYFSDIKFDFVLYSTPPITFTSVIKYIKKRDGAKTYLMLKDIFPQNAVDLGMMNTAGVKGLIYKFFRKKEKELYSLSDRIGCMSPANVEYVLCNNKEIPEKKVEVCPNSIDPIEQHIFQDEINTIRIKYCIPLDRRVFVYGGNMGKPQGVPFLLECLRNQKENKNVFFLLIGDGTEYHKLVSFIEEEKPENVKLMNSLPKVEYDRIISACDVGMIFLDHRFTIPNFPSRILSYMQARLPVLSVTDPNTDIGKLITEGEFGWCSTSDSVEKFSELIEKISLEDLEEYKNNSWEYLVNFFSVQKTYANCFENFSRQDSQ